MGDYKLFSYKKGILWNKEKNQVIKRFHLVFSKNKTLKLKLKDRYFYLLNYTDFYIFKVISGLKISLQEQRKIFSKNDHVKHSLQEVFTDC